MSTITQANASYVSDETVSIFAFDEFIQAQPRMPTLFTQQGSSTYREIRGSMSGLTDFSEKVALADPSEDSPIQQFKKEFVHREFALAVKVERKVYEDQQFPFFEQLGRKIGESAVRTFEKYAAKVFNEAFSSSNYLAEDALSLCNDAHLNSDGANSQDNKGTTALSYAAVDTTRTAMKRFTDYRGNVMAVEPDLLLVPVTLERTAYEITRSSGDPTNANNVANFFNGQLSTLTWTYLDAVDTNNWFLIDSRLMKQNLFWYWRMVLEIFGDGDAFKGLRRIGGYYRSSHDSIDWRWIYGHSVT
jgi:phage major head subunit gpT-like protein